MEAFGLPRLPLAPGRVHRRHWGQAVGWVDGWLLASCFHRKSWGTLICGGRCPLVGVPAGEIPRPRALMPWAHRQVVRCVRWVFSAVDGFPWGVSVWAVGGEALEDLRDALSGGFFGGLPRSGCGKVCRIQDDAGLAVVVTCICHDTASAVGSPMFLLLSLPLPFSSCRGRFVGARGSSAGSSCQRLRGDAAGEGWLVVVCQVGFLNHPLIRLLRLLSAPGAPLREFVGRLRGDAAGKGSGRVHRSGSPEPLPVPSSR